jgi:hypothetical protein
MLIAALLAYWLVRPAGFFNHRLRLLYNPDQRQQRRERMNPSNARAAGFFVRGCWGGDRRAITGGRLAEVKP